MLLSLQKLGFNRHHHRNRHRHSHHRISKASLDSLQAFRHEVSKNLHRLSESSYLGPEFWSLGWIRRCFEMLPILNNAFAKLMAEIDYPMSKWEAYSIDEYLDYTINVLQLLNSISSSLLHLRRSRVTLSRALSLIPNSPTHPREIRLENPIKEFTTGANGGSEGSGKELIFHEAMLTLRSCESWVCGVVLSGLMIDPRPYMEMRNGVRVDPSLMDLDSILVKEIVEKKGVVKEVKEVNETVLALIVSGGNGDSEVAEELWRRMEVVEIGLKGLKEKEEDMFSKVLDARNEVLEILRWKNQ